MALEMKYFVLKPKGNSPFAEASRSAMLAYAKSIESTDAFMARSLRIWAENEGDRVVNTAQPEQGEGGNSAALLNGIKIDLGEALNLKSNSDLRMAIKAIYSALPVGNTTQAKTPAAPTPDGEICPHHYYGRECYFKRKWNGIKLRCSPKACRANFL